MKRILPLLVALTVLLSGCMSGNTKSGGGSLMDEIMLSWVGADIDDAFDQWGYPTRETSTFKGNRVFMWEKNASVTLPGSPGVYIPGTSATTTGRIAGNRIHMTTYGGTPGQVVGATAPQTIGGFYCTRTLEIGSDGVITKGTYRGNNCPFMELFEYANWRKK